MRYCRLICSKKWLSERPNCRGMFLRLRGMTVVEWCENRGCFSLSGCHLAVSQSYAGYHTSFERGESGLPADIKIRTILSYWLVIYDHILEYSGVYQWGWTFWSVILQPLGALQSTIYHLKGETHIIHMRHCSLMCTHRLHRKINFGRLPFFPLVLYALHNLSPRWGNIYDKKYWIILNFGNWL